MYALNEVKGMKFCMANEKNKDIVIVKEACKNMRENIKSLKEFENKVSELLGQDQADFIKIEAIRSLIEAATSDIENVYHYFEYISSYYEKIINIDITFCKNVSSNDYIDSLIFPAENLLELWRKDLDAFKDYINLWKMNTKELEYDVTVKQFYFSHLVLNKVSSFLNDIIDDIEKTATVLNDVHKSVENFLNTAFG